MHSPRLTNTRLGAFLASRSMLYGPAPLVLLLIAGGGWYGYWEYAKRRLALAEAARPKPKADPVLLSYPGKVRAQTSIKIPAPVAGTLEAVEVLDGQEVFEGQLLARIQNTSLESVKLRALEDLDRAKSKLSDVESQLLAARLEASRAGADMARARSEYNTTARAYERLQKLFREGAAARLAFEKAEATYRRLAQESQELEEAAQSADKRVANMQANVDEARATVNEKTSDLEEADAGLLTGEVKSPVAGLLIGHRKNAGDEVTRDIGDLFEIATDLTAMEVVADIPEALARRIAALDHALVQITEAGEAPLNGTVRTVKDGQAVVEFLSPNSAIRPGMSARVRFLSAH